MLTVAIPCSACGKKFSGPPERVGTQADCPAAKIDFATLVSIDEAARTITLQADAAKILKLHEERSSLRKKKTRRQGAGVRGQTAVERGTPYSLPRTE